VNEYFEAHVRVESGDWSFGAHQAAARAAATEELITLRRQYRHMGEREVAELAESWRPDDASGPYFVFAAAPLGGQDEPVAVSATFLQALFLELLGETPTGLAALLEQWSDQRRYAWESGQQPVAVRQPRVSALVPRDTRQWSSKSWDTLAGLDLEAPELDSTLLVWDGDSGDWIAHPLD
jgi:hypothetical protein